MFYETRNVLLLWSAAAFRASDTLEWPVEGETTF